MIVLFFILLPFVELWGLIVAGGALGALTIMLWVFFSVLLGIAMVRSAGFLALQQLGAQQDGAPQLLSGALIVVGGLALIVPGLFTDALGLACLWRPSRDALARFILKHAGVHAFVGKYSSKVPFARRQNENNPSGPNDPNEQITIDGVWRDDEKDR